MIEVIFDIETQKLFSDITGDNIADLGVSIVSAYKRNINDEGDEIDGKMDSFWIDDLSGLWSLFSGVDRIIGFNSNSFDVPVLLPLAPYDLKKLPHFDILEQVKNSLGFRLSLDAIAKETLGHSKTDVGTNAVKYWNEKTTESLKKLKDYCEMDVIVTKEVYDFGKKNKHLKYKDKWNTSRTVEIDFSYPIKVDNGQMGLF